MGRVRKRSRELSGPMQDWIQEKLNKKWTAKQINDHLQRLRPSPREGAPGELDKFLEEMKADKLPSYEQIRRIANDLTIPDTSGTWDPRDKDTTPEDLRCILDLLAWVILDTKGKKTTLTKAEVDWMLRIAKAAPSARYRVIWRLVQHYMLAEARRQPTTEALDTYLAFKPWESANRFSNYSYLLKQGWITEPPGRYEMDGVGPNWEREGLLEWHFSRESHEGTPLDYDPLDFHFKVSGGRSSTRDHAMVKIRLRKPSLYYRILAVWDEASQREAQDWDDATERARQAGKPLEDDKEEYYRIEGFTKLNYDEAWEKYDRLVDFFKDDAALNLTHDQTEEEFNRILAVCEEKESPKEKRAKKEAK